MYIFFCCKEGNYRVSNLHACLVTVSTCIPQGEWVSMGVMSDGSYGIPKGIIYSFPVRVKKDRSWEIVQGLSVSDFAREKMDATATELVEERDLAFQFVSSGTK